MLTKAFFRGINVGSKEDMRRLLDFVTPSEMRFEDVIDREFGFADASNAFEYLWSGKHTGKVVIAVEDSLHCQP
jgi:NADPH-dependent curcumin reductase CurA